MFERPKGPLDKWLLATHLMASSTKGMSAHQLHHPPGVTDMTAWFMFHRIPEAMDDPAAVSLETAGGTVEVDETLVGRSKGMRPVGQRKGRGGAHKHGVLALVDRDTGKARSTGVDDLRPIHPSPDPASEHP